MVGLTARFSNPLTLTPVEKTNTRSEINSTQGGSRPRQKQRRLNETEVRELVEAYVAGATIAGLAKQWNIHRTTVMDHLDRAGIKRRPVKKTLPQGGSVRKFVYRA